MDRVVTALRARAASWRAELERADELMARQYARLLVEPAPDVDPRSVATLVDDELEDVAVYEVALLSAVDEDLFSFHVVGGPGEVSALYERATAAPSTLAAAVVDAIIEALKDAPPVVVEPCAGPGARG